MNLTEGFADEPLVSIDGGAVEMTIPYSRCSQYRLGNRLARDVVRTEGSQPDGRHLGPTAKTFPGYVPRIYAIVTTCFLAIACDCACH